MLKRIGGRWQILLGAAIASTPLLAVLIGQSSTRSGRVALYAGVGEELSAHRRYRAGDVDETVVRHASRVRPEAWASPSTPYLHVAWSNGGASWPAQVFPPQVTSMA